MPIATVAQVLDILDGLEIKSTHLFWKGKKPPPLPYAVLVPHESRNAYADGHVLLHSRRYDIELYARERDMPLELSIQQALDEAEIPYSSDVVADEENRFAITYFSTTLTE